MQLIQLVYIIVGIICCFFLMQICLTSIRESKARASVISAVMLIIFIILWFGNYLVFGLEPIVLIISIAVVSLFTLLFFIPIGKPNPIQIGEITERVDERDTIFAREEYEPGTARYDAYYVNRPEYKPVDDKLRKLPELLKPAGRYYDPVRSTYVESVFQYIKKLSNEVDADMATTCTQTNPEEFTKTVKRLVLQMGAVDVGVADLNPVFVYSHVGRGPEPWGTSINNTHRFVIVFSLEMDYSQVEQAPYLSVTEETAIQYLKGAVISISLAEYIRQLGYPARAHVAGSNYQIMLPPAAYYAGLGELGRMGYLISPKLGARIRLGAVTTDLPLIPDKPITFGVQDFCEKCLKCAINCPSNAIPKGSKKMVRGVEKWLLKTEKCLQYWRIVGTDCALCMRVCPYSHPQSLMHNIVKSGIARSRFARTVSVYGDDLLYGKKVRY